MGRYLPLCRVTVAHDFYAGGAGPGFDFVPAAPTAALVERLGLLVRQDGAAVHVFYDGDRRDALQGELARGAACRLTFAAAARDRAFTYVTTPAVQRPDAILFFRSPGRTPRRARGPLPLHAGEVAGDADFRPLAPVLARVTGGRREWGRRPDFVVTLAVRARDVAADGDPAGGAAYTIRFDARRTVWKYYLLGAAASRTPRIVDASGEIDFEFVGPAALPGRRTALAFRSTSPIALRDRYDLKFQLRDSGAGGGKVLIRRLPGPAVEQFGKDTINGQDTIVSEIYVNS